MRSIAKWIACLVILAAPAVASAGLKWKDCINSDFLVWKEYLVGGGQGQPGNELWGKANAGTCGIELYDLTLIQATSQTAPSGYQAMYVTQYDNGFLGTLLGPYANVIWNVSGTVTALLDNSGIMHSTLDLFGTSALHPGETLEAEITSDFLPVVAGHECLPWDNGFGCTQYDYIGGSQNGPGQAVITSSFVQVVPEPGTLALVVSALLVGLGSLRRRVPRSAAAV